MLILLPTTRTRADSAGARARGRKIEWMCENEEEGQDRIGSGETVFAGLAPYFT